MNQNDETMIIRTKAEDRKARRRVLGMPVIIAVPLAAILAFSGVAVAAMLLFGTGSVQAQAYEGKALTISNEKLSKQLYPGAVADLQFTVSNENPFPVTLTGVAATGASGFTAGCQGGTMLEGKVANLNQSIALSEVVPAGGSKTVTVEEAVKLKAAATAGCGFKVDIKVTGSGAGN